MSATASVESLPPLFLAPHYDDVALSCGGTVAALADAGLRPRILTIFGGVPSEPLTDFARFQHERWGLDVEQAVAERRAEELAAATCLGAEIDWLDFPDAIYRDARYTSDDDIFGPLHPDDAPLIDAIQIAITSELRSSAGVSPTRAEAPRIYVSLGVGNHVDHQLVTMVGARLAARGAAVWAYEDFPYAGDPAHIELLLDRARQVAFEPPELRRLSVEELDRRVQAILCYRSQLPVIFRHQGDPAASTRRYAALVGNGVPAERFWRLRPAH